jgi:hypothetical protein
MLSHQVRDLEMVVLTRQAYRITEPEIAFGLEHVVSKDCFERELGKSQKTSGGMFQPFKSEW